MNITDFKAEFSFSDTLITPATISRVMGYEHDDAPEPVLILINEAISNISSINDIRAEYKIFDSIELNNKEKALYISDVCFNLKSIIFKQIKESTAVALFICTAGRSLEELIRSAKKENDLLLEYVYDIIGSEIAEAAASRMEENLRSVKNNEGLNISMRFSPGYCGWEVQEQKKLFSFFPDNFCGITLSESSFMSPVKSVSGIAGIGACQYKTIYQCHICNDKYCIYRNKNKPM
jgi:hypothetical protein